MEAVILAGGLGTRLRSVVTDLPKVMAPVGELPFLAYVLQGLQRQGFTRVILSVGYRHDVIQTYFGDSYQGLSLEYAIEKTPLGTGGALKYALSMVTTENMFVLNGDTLMLLDYQAMAAQHQNAALSMALRQMDDCGRYGRVTVSESIVTDFIEKQAATPGYINAGVYLLNVAQCLPFMPEGVFSLEQDFLTPALKNLQPKAFISDGYFCDIGVPEDYQKFIIDVSQRVIAI